MISREEFEGYLNTLVKDEDLTHAKKKIKSKRLIGLFVILVGVGICVYGMLTNSNFTKFLPIVLGVALVIVGLLIFAVGSVSGYKALEKKFKKQVIEYLLQDTDHTYREHEFINESIYIDARLPRHGYNVNPNKDAEWRNSRVVFGQRIYGDLGYDYYSGEDYLRLNIPDDNNGKTDCNLYISDILVKNTETDNENNEKTVTLYQGVLGYIEFPFEFKCELTINRPEYGFAENLDKVQLEGIDFNKKFTIKTSDQLEARYIITTDMMMKLLQLEQRVRKIGIVMHGNRMYITMPNKNIFSLGTTSKKLDATCFLNIYDDLAMLLALIKEIQRNNKVFKM